MQPKHYLKTSVYFGRSTILNSITGLNGGTIFVYTIKDLLSEEVLYVGSGKISCLIKQLGSKMEQAITHGNYALDIIWDCEDDTEALIKETLLIAGFNPPLNKARFGTRGGRPRGSSMTSEARKKISNRMIGRSNSLGSVPWNKGLTIEDPRIARMAEKRNNGDKVSIYKKVAYTRKVNDPNNESAKRTWATRRARYGSSGRLQK